MSLAAVLRTLVRRWYLVLVGLLATAGLCVVVLQSVAPTYEASGSILLVPPTDALGDTENPLVALGTLEQATNVLVEYANSDAARRSVADVAPGATYVAMRDTMLRAPVVLVDVEAPTAAGATGAVEAVLDYLPGALAEVEGSVDVPEGSRIRTLVLSEAEEVTAVTRGTQRALLAAAGVGVLATALGVAVVDGLLRRRERTRA